MVSRSEVGEEIYLLFGRQI